MASMFRSGSSRRKAEAPGKIRIQLKGKSAKVMNADDDDERDIENTHSTDNNQYDDDDEGDNLPVTFDNGIPDDLPEGTFVVQPEAVEDSPVKKKREAPVRIDTSVLDSVSCTACGRQLNPYKGGALQKHPQLKVVICKRCEKFLSSGEIAKDKDGTDEQCRWCGEGGRLVVCDECASAFCKTCVMRNFNRSEFNNINSQPDWKCYLCNKAPLQGLRENYRKIRDTLKALHAKDSAKDSTKTQPPAANPTTNGTQPSEKSAGPKHVKVYPPFGVQDGKLSGAVAAQKNILPPVGMAVSGMKSRPDSGHKLLDHPGIEGIMISSKDINVNSENVFTVIEKLAIATNSFREVLHLLQSQCQYSVPSYLNIQALGIECTRALNMGLDTYLKSLKTILSGSSSYMCDPEMLLAGPRYKRHVGGINPTSSILTSGALASHRQPEMPGIMPMGTNLSEMPGIMPMGTNLSEMPGIMPMGTNFHSNGNINSYLSQQCSSSSSPSSSATGRLSEIKQEIGQYFPKNIKENTKYINQDNGGLIKREAEQTGSDVEQHDSSHLVSQNIEGISVSGSAEVTAESKNCAKNTRRNVSTKNGSESSRSVKNQDISGVKDSNEPSTSNSKQNIKGDDNSQPREPGEDEKAQTKRNTSKKVQKNNNAKMSSQKHEEMELSKSSEEKALAPIETCDAVGDELAEEIHKDEKDEGEESNATGRNNENDAKVGGKVENTFPSTTSTRRKSQTISKEATLQKAAEPKASGIQCGKAVKSKENQKTESVNSAGDDVSDCQSTMSDDDVDLATRKKKKEVVKNSEKTSKPVTGKKENLNADNKSKTVGKSDNTKSNGKGASTVTDSRETGKRKRKATNIDEEDIEESTKADAKPGSLKKAKSDPRSTKKDMSDDLPSEGDDKKDVAVNASDDDDDEPPVTFFLNPAEDEDQQDESEDESSIANDESVADMEDEENGGVLGGDSDKAKKSIKAKKMKKGRRKRDESGDDEDDADECEGSSQGTSKRKKTPHSAPSSESEADVDKPKKIKRDEDEDGDFKQEESCSSSVESDISDSENAGEESGDSDEQEEDGEPKSKKKGKKKKQSKKKKKKGKGKKTAGDDDAESDDKEEEDEEDEDSEGGGKKKKKSKGKKKAKKVDSSDEDAEAEEKEDDDDDDPNSSKTGKRKQIRKVMSNKKLEDSTRAAAKAEEKRRKRIASKQREFNIETITDENNPMNCPVTTKLVLELGKEEDEEPIIQVNKTLVRKLKPHQVEAVQFLWDCMYESVKRSKKEQGSGCILAHCMGLGKTLSVVAFVHTILSHEKLLKHRTCLVVSPLNTVLNWRNEWSMWLDEEDQLEVWELASCKQNAARAEALKEWQAAGGVMIMGYEMYRNLTTGSRCKNKRQKKVFQETLVDPGPDVVVCDEGHILKNEASAISKAMNQMKTRRRVVLTGTPLQNNLNEYHCMVSFVKPNLLGTRKEFTNRFINPIQNGQCTDSTQRDVKIMKARAHVLHEMLAGCVQRRDYSALTKFLPPKQEYVISVRLTNIQVELYEKYLEMTGQGLDGVFNNKGARLFTDYQNLMKIWTHPWVLKLAEIRDEMKMKFDDDEDSFIDDDSDEDKSFSSSSSSSEDDKAVSDSGGKGATSRGINMQRGTRRTRAKARRQAGEDSDPEEVLAEWRSKTRTTKGSDGDIKSEEQDKSVTKEWWAQYVTEDDKLKLELSNKLHLLFEILRMCEEIGDKVLIFSQSILSLNIIESFLEVVDSKFQQECENLPDEEKEKEVFGRSWTKNLDYYRMDGSTSAQNRQLWASSFNDLENYRARLFLISTRAGGLGINLVAANRVIIFDASWNPSHDVQSIFRVYRFGQTKPCYIYRFLAQGTMEEKIYERQVTKLSLSQRVVDEHQIERHFSANDLKELYNFRPERWDDGTEKPTLALPKDPLLAEILTSNRHCIVSFHEHDSLLENQIEQTLTEEEKKAAWEEYENEKKGIIIRGPGMERAASWPMMAAAQILSREQITATVQALRQQLPDISEDLFHLHVQQALRRQVQIKQEEMRRMELLRLQEMNYLNMIKQHAQQSGLSHAQSLQAMQSMAPWMQIQRLRAMQQSMLMGGGHLGMLPQASMSLLGQALSTNHNQLSNKPEDAIDLDDN